MSEYKSVHEMVQKRTLTTIAALIRKDSPCGTVSRTTIHLFILKKMVVNNLERCRVAGGLLGKDIL